MSRFNRAGRGEVDWPGPDGTAAGDILVFDGTEFVIRSVGTNGQVLTVATGNSDQLEWASGGGASGGSPSVILATATASGAATTFVRTDDTIKAFDGTTPAGVSLTAGNQGTTSYAARSDHAHLLPTVTIAKGGTGQTNQTSAFDALSPTTTLGDVIVYGAGGFNARVAKGGEGQVFMTDTAGLLNDVGWSDPAFLDSLFRILDNADPTKKVAFQVSSLSAGVTRTYVGPDKDGTLAMTSDIPTAGSPSIILATATSAGVATTFLRTDATIQAYDSTAVMSSVLSATAAGTSSYAARADHTHKLGMGTAAGDVLAFNGTTFVVRPIGTHGQFLSVATANADKLAWVAGGGASGGSPSVVFATATAAGAASTFVRTDDTVKAFDGTVPASIGITNTDGTTSYAQRSGHTHRMGILTTKGDLLTHDGTDPARLGVGAQYTAPMADSNQTYGWSWQPMIRRALKTGLQNFTVTAAADITDLTLTAAASTSYSFMFQIPFVTTGTTNGLKLGITFPSSPTYVNYDFKIPTSTTAIVQQTFTATGQTLTAATSPGTTGATATIIGTLVNGVSSGVVQAQAASEANTATVTVNRGAWGWMV